MKKNFAILSCILVCQYCSSQNVGIGTTTPSAKLNVVNTGTIISEFANSTPLSIDVNTRLLFKTGSFYTGAIGTYGTGINSSRLGLSSFATLTSSSMIERLSILDNGRVGINTTTPGFQLDVNGDAHTSGDFYVDGRIGIGTIPVAQKLEVNGNIKVTGNVIKPATGTASMLPYAYGKIDANGVIMGSTGNFSVVKTAVEGNFVVTLTGDNNLYANRNQYTIVASINESFGATVSSYIQGDNTILVRTSSYSPDFWVVRAWVSFNIIIYRLQ